MDTLADRTARLMKDRAKDAENAPGARLGRAVRSELAERVVAGVVRDMPEPKPTIVKDLGTSMREPVERVRDPEQMRLRPAGYEPVGHAPQVGSMGAGLTTSRQWFLNKQHAMRAHEQAQDRTPEPATERTPSGSAMERLGAIKGSDGRPVTRMIPARMQDLDNDRGR